MYLVLVVSDFHLCVLHNVSVTVDTQEVLCIEMNSLLSFEGSKNYLLESSASQASKNIILKQHETVILTV